MQGFAWIRTVNMLNRVASLLAFLYFVFSSGFTLALKYGVCFVIVHFIVNRIGLVLNNRIGSDPIEQLAIMRGSMPPGLLKIMLLTTLLLVLANLTLFLYFAK